MRLASAIPVMTNPKYLYFVPRYMPLDFLTPAFGLALSSIHFHGIGGKELEADVDEM